MKKYISLFVSGILAGILIGLASVVKVLTSPLVGAILFGLGLFLIMVFGLFLYTGKIGFVLDNKPSYLLDLGIGLAGNFLGIVGLTKLLLLTRVGDALKENARILVEAKEADTWYSLLILAIFCGFMIYLACIAFKTEKSGFGKTISVFLCITFFILSGYEHCIANAAYYSLACMFDAHALLSFVMFVLGNSIGAILLDFLFKIFKKWTN